MEIFLSQEEAERLWARYGAEFEKKAASRQADHVAWIENVKVVQEAPAARSLARWPAGRLLQQLAG